MCAKSICIRQKENVNREARQHAGKMGKATYKIKYIYDVYVREKMDTDGKICLWECFCFF